MLKSLMISNFALVESARIEFEPGLTIITGETGAGKSIIIDALACVLGERTSIDSIRTGHDFLRVEAAFDITKTQTAAVYLEEMAIPVEDAENVIMTRRISAAGKNQALINGCQVTVNTLKRFAQFMMDIHGQHESQSLLRSDLYIAQLDVFSQDIQLELAAYQKLYQEWKQVCAKLEEAQAKSRERERKLDMLSWQSKEIAAAALTPDEDVVLEKQIKLLANREKIVTSAHAAYNLISSETGEKLGALEQLAETKKHLEYIARFDTNWSEKSSSLDEIIVQLSDMEHELRNYFQEMDFESGRLSELQARMDTIYKLKKKYGQTTAEIITYYNQTLLEIEELQSIDSYAEQLDKRVETLTTSLKQFAYRLDTLRRQAGAGLQSAIEKHLADLGMPGVRFVIEVHETEQFNERGKNQISFLFSANLGEELRPLQKIASGGELSRIALAMKAVSANEDVGRSMIFDELDTGIGGKTAQMVADKIALVSEGRQVICITHLPHIAVMGDNHLYVEKFVEQDITKTVVHLLKGEAQTKEIARMISGDDQSKATLTNAEKMLKDAKTKKEIWKKKAQA